MARVICENCKIEIQVPDGYSAPFLQCPDCGSIQEYQRIVPGEPKFKILGHIDRKRVFPSVSSNTSKKQIEEQPEKQTQNLGEKPAIKLLKQSANKAKAENNSEYKPVDMKQALLESMGEEGLNKAYIYASSYMWSSSEKVRKNGKAKAIQKLMKEKYPLEMASKAIEFAEKAPETEALAKQKIIKFIIIIVVVIVIIIAILMAFL